MKHLLAGFGVGLFVVTVVAGAGIANAVNEYKGLTYEETVGYVGSNAVITGRSGEHLPTEKCIVTGSKTDKKTGKVYLFLNCNDTSALNGHPGNSVTTPEGKKALAVREQGVQISEYYKNETAAGNKELTCDVYRDSCIKVCKESGTCSDALLEYLGL